MDLKEQIIQEYLTQGCGFRSLAAKYGVSRTTICKWVQIHQGIHNLPPTKKQLAYATSSMNSHPQKDEIVTQTQQQLQQQIEALQQQLKWEKLRAQTLDTIITIAEQKLTIDIRKKFGTQQHKK